MRRLLTGLSLFVGLLIVVEAGLYWRLPQRTLPFSGVRDGVSYTWGQAVAKNRFGFRERDFATPKPPGTFRVMVLGDSFTFGVGLEMEERYTERTEAMLRERHPHRDIEILNFGVSGASLVDYRDTLRGIGVDVQPDLIVVGFCLNDPQLRRQDFSIERERIQKEFSFVFSALERYGRIAPYTARRSNEAIWSWLERFGVVPRWPEALDRTYRPDSAEWIGFVAALRDIRELSDGMSLPPPIFSILNQGSSTVAPTSYANPDPLLRKFLEWYRLAERAAQAAGFRTVEHSAEFAARLDGRVLAVNRIDGHPNAEQNQIYAEKLATVLDVAIAAATNGTAGTERASGPE